MLSSFALQIVTCGLYYHITNISQLSIIAHGVVNGQPLPSTQYTRAAPALPGGGGVDVGKVGMKDSAVLSRKVP